MLLSESDHLVGTFSSQFSRIAYELMQSREFSAAEDWKDLSTAATSLDDDYYGGQNRRYVEAIYPHAEGNFSFNLGDVLVFGGHYKNGTSYGLKQTANEQIFGSYPSFKTIDTFDVFPFAGLDDE